MASDDDFGGPPPIEIPTESLEFEHVQRDKTVKSSLGRRLLLITILVAAVGGAGAWWVFDGQYSNIFASNNDGQVPTVHAEITPVKIKPANPGGMDVPNQDKLVYERLGQKPPQERVERLLPDAEKPMPKPKPEPKPVVAPEPEKPVAPAKVAADKMEPPKPPAIPTKKVVEEKIASMVPTEKEVAAVKAPKPAEVVAPAEVKKPEPKPTPVVEAKPAPKPVAKPAPKPAPKPVAKPAPAPKPTVSKSYQVQLAAVRSTATAQSEWKRMQRRFPGELGKLSLNVVRADLGKKGIFYRLRAGPVANASAAKAICSALKAKKSGCLIVRPGK